ncbi:hypothetical protein [Ornithinimicrobium panacihumi]|uniref:hypothetical protein n=1 Tax=Ornithinimicrobium panacihumi TaxID=2008449 RepID=UPI003F88EAB3
MTELLSRQKAAVQRMRKALNDYHAAVRRTDRDTALYPAERDQALTQARATAEAAIAAAREDFRRGIQADRAERARYVDNPSGQDLERRRYWQGTAQSDLAGLGSLEAAALIQNLVANGATGQAAEYVRVARPVLDGATYMRLAQATMPPEAKKADSTAAALDAFEHVTLTEGWLDEHAGNLLHQAGTITQDEREGQPSAYDDRALSLLMQRAEATAVAALHERAAYLDGGGQDG